MAMYNQKAENTILHHSTNSIKITRYLLSLISFVNYQFQTLFRFIPTPHSITRSNDELPT